MPQPYKKVDMEHPSSEGCSLYDEASSFYATYCPLAGGLPEKCAVTAALKTAMDGCDASVLELAANLQATNLTALWPGQDNPPPATIGILWVAANSLKECVTPTPTPERATPERATPENIVMNSRVNAVDTPEEIVSKRKGRKPGTKRWTAEELNLLLWVVEDVLPAGNEMWELVSLNCQKEGKNWRRVGTACKAKFEGLAFPPKPTGSAEIPIFIQRTKEIKDKIAQKEVIGYSLLNEIIQGEDAMLSESDEVTSKSLQATQLADSDGHVICPPAMKQKSLHIADALVTIGSQFVVSSSKIEHALGGIAGALASRVKTPTFQPENLQSSAWIEKLEASVQSIEDKLSTIVGLLTNKAMSPHNDANQKK